MIIQKFLKSSKGDIFVVYHWHSSKASSIIISPGLSNSLAEPRYLFPIIARRLYSLGFNVFLFDYLGDGDSTGDFVSIDLNDIIKTLEQVMNFVLSLGVSQIGLIGYGVGNIIQSSFLHIPEVKTAIFISPHLFFFLDSKKYLNNIFLKKGEILYPKIQSSNNAIEILLESVIGEKVVDGQFPGPISTTILLDLKNTKFYKQILQTPKSMFILSEDKKDIENIKNSTIVTEIIKHTPSEYKASWHWCVTCREQLINQISSWLDIQLTNKVHDIDMSELKSTILYTKNNFHDEDYTPKNSVRTLPITIDIKGEGSILGILHVPNKRNYKYPVCIVYEVGNPGQRVDIHRSGPRVANFLAKNGFYVFRYDNRCMGVSSGDFHDFTLSNKINDTKYLLQNLLLIKPYIKKFIFVSNSAGAKSVVIETNHNSNVIGSVLWGPILLDSNLSGGNSKIKRHKQTGQLITEYCGLNLGIKYNIDEKNYDFLTTLKNCNKPFLVLFAHNESNVLNRKEIENIIGKQPEKEIVVFPGSHGFASESIDNVITKTHVWIKNLILKNF